MGKGFFFIGHYYDGIRLIVMIRESVCIVLYEIQNNDIRLDELNTTLERVSSMYSVRLLSYSFIFYIVWK